MIHIRFFGITAAFCFCLVFFVLPFSAGEDISATQTAENSSEPEPVEPLEITLSVNEIRLDVVVLDKKGNPITDLTAADFVVYQDNKRQEILASVYIDSQPDAEGQSTADQKELTNLPLQHTSALKKEDVHRTIVFLVDDFAMTFENSYYTKMALRNFVEKQMMPGDLVAILRTDYGNSALNMFHSDKREALARINAMPLSLSSTKNILMDERVNFLEKFGKNQVSNITYAIRTLKNMPGRKIINMITPATLQATNYSSYMKLAGDYYDACKRLADDALRAGAVVNILDIEGLYNFEAHGADASAPIGRSFNGPLPSIEVFTSPLLIQARNEFTPRPISNPIAEKTGGVFIKNTNFFFDGIGRETESMMRGYYLVSYAPPPDTFKGRGKRDEYRRLKVDVKRKDAVVYTREGFFSRLESESDAETSENPLLAAIYSPFQSTDLNVDIAAGYVKNEEAGYFVRSWIHLDPGNVKIIKTEDGSARIDLEAICLTSDITGKIQDSVRVEFTTSKFDADWIQRHGIRFSMLLPVKKPGPYYIRVSIKDKESGKIGSAYQFLEIPDLKKRGLALSNIFMITSADDLAWMSSDITKEVVNGVFFPMYQGEDVRSPALRTYEPGDSLQILAMLYNTDAKAANRSEIEIQTILYKDGQELKRNEPVPVSLVSDPDGFKIFQKFKLGQEMPPGDYVLQLAVNDKKNGKKEEGSAFQTLGFTVVEK